MRLGRVLWGSLALFAHAGLVGEVERQQQIGGYS
jgi:hypothetical protein